MEKLTRSRCCQDLEEDELRAELDGESARDLGRRASQTAALLCQSKLLFIESIVYIRQFCTILCFLMRK